MLLISESIMPQTSVVTAVSRAKTIILITEKTAMLDIMAARDNIPPRLKLFVLRLAEDITRATRSNILIILSSIYMTVEVMIRTTVMVTDSTNAIPVMD